MKKLVVIWICSLLLLGWYTSAHDCGLVANTGNIDNSEWYKKFTENFQGTNIEWVMPAEAVSKALMNLKSTCCEGENMNNKEMFCIWYPKKPNPDSEFFYDQLLDIWLRRLDGNSDLAYNVKLDSKGEERRKFITEAAQDKVGSITAKKVLEKRNENWTRKKIYVDNRTITQFQDAIDNYKDQTLADRYYNICNVIWIIYEKIRTDKTKVINIATCQSLINKRISDEATYTKIIAIKKSNELLHNTIQAYTQKYFVEEKMMVLLTLLNKVKSLFSTMVQQAPASQSCSQ